jgi:hypothetical protein
MLCFFSANRHSSMLFSFSSLDQCKIRAQGCCFLVCPGHNPTPTLTAGRSGLCHLVQHDHLVSVQKGYLACSGD